MVVEPEALTLRQADAFDAPALAELRVASLLEMGMLDPRDAAEFLPRARGEFWRLLREERVAAWMLFAGRQAAGCACVVFFDRLPYPPTSLHAELAGVYVAPEHRRRGIARELIAEALASAQARGVRKIVLSPTADMRAYYRSLGFSDSGQLRR